MLKSGKSTWHGSAARLRRWRSARRFRVEPLEGRLMLSAAPLELPPPSWVSLLSAESAPAQVSGSQMMHATNVVEGGFISIDFLTAGLNGQVQFGGTAGLSLIEPRGVLATSDTVVLIPSANGGNATDGNAGEPMSRNNDTIVRGSHDLFRPRIEPIRIGDPPRPIQDDPGGEIPIDRTLRREVPEDSGRLGIRSTPLDDNADESARIVSSPAHDADERAAATGRQSGALGTSAASRGETRLRGLPSPPRGAIASQWARAIVFEFADEEAAWKAPDRALNGQEPSRAMDRETSWNSNLPQSTGGAESSATPVGSNQANALSDAAQRSPKAARHAASNRGSDGAFDRSASLVGHWSAAHVLSRSSSAEGKSLAATPQRDLATEQSRAPFTTGSPASGEQSAAVRPVSDAVRRASFVAAPLFAAVALERIAASRRRANETLAWLRAIRGWRV